jgi:predicted signal transduction protein with EAL and GGDEF domain
VTVSIGVAALNRDGTGAADLTALLAAADSALYRAKQDGRNKTCLASDSPLAQVIPAARPAPLTGPRPAPLVGQRP